MKLYLLLTIHLFTTLYSKQLSSIDCSYNSYVTDTSKWTGYVFIIDLDKRKSSTEVQKPGNWEFIGTDDKITVHCAPGKLQACQLIVDENDTYVLLSGERKLKPRVLIVARKANVFWYVSQFISTNNYTHQIFNEEESAQ